ncbi:MAG: hypothetical protein GY833_22420 [Aestuariibacter sp.]|nr:hypothetical protein [Aestuariibacter sp.]
MSIATLRTYVAEHTTCVEAGTGTTPIEFFDVNYKGDVEAAGLRQLVESAREGEFGSRVDLFDGKEHSYIELGGWIGSQDLALRLMALGCHLKIWKLLTPSNVLPADTPDDVKEQLSRMGMITVTYLPNEEQSDDGEINGKLSTEH